ncbi:hypothetical protein [Candidatus Nitrosocosmicus hydrocola]|uniref:hypothetical protein n=1 Tax=Candidatus Nitrosocosmicus hydrocola TaxID=1826872 RepID=UPI0011E5B178|nr:hypothetical protein [Candidatus Nitrosocosmicus hydrocola]
MDIENSLMDYPNVIKYNLMCIKTKRNLTLNVFWSLIFMFVFANISYSYVSAQPTWELYENKICAISLMHPFTTDKISESTIGAFQIESVKQISDPDSLNMNISASCIDKKLPITEETMNLTLSGLKKELQLVSFEENSFNGTFIGGERASSVTTGGPIGNGDLMTAVTVTQVNLDNSTFIIRISSLGDDGLSGFVNNHNYLRDNIISSIKLLD